MSSCNLAPPLTLVAVAAFQPFKSPYLTLKEQTELHPPPKKTHKAVKAVAGKKESFLKPS